MALYYGGQGFVKYTSPLCISWVSFMPLSPPLSANFTPHNEFNKDNSATIIKKCRRDGRHTNPKLGNDRDVAITRRLFHALCKYVQNFQKLVMSSDKHASLPGTPVADVGQKVTGHVFLRLPEELRLQVLEYFLVAKQPITNPWMESDLDGDNGENVHTWKKGLDISMLLVSKDMHRLGIKLLYGRNTFRFTRRPLMKVRGATSGEDDSRRMQPVGAMVANNFRVYMILSGFWVKEYRFSGVFTKRLLNDDGSLPTEDENRSDLDGMGGDSQTVSEASDHGEELLSLVEEDDSSDADVEGVSGHSDNDNSETQVEAVGIEG
ncbi:uncharacterized protein LY89DRAFT_784411 [Mollisia scopiformis]|uniref:Uncharacterized protein n=1 Tax=Mollisia scopiformis TaxID=149040 RepID=A0A194X3S4_MOLSC|nr:uncharacterized protein LY89DRAFT_784411 [Mollisia scopiformis]KUJ14472.1 hypothetical protein LY89DRAFT_784411 [Mollisia scopiformis]